jgi:cellulose synthase/poly-beta-1,6-N-acetylglucosamine synthase-like glycosyltransferase
VSLILEVLLVAAALTVLIPAAVLFGEVVAAVTGRGRTPAKPGDRPRIAVLVPAHDEQSTIAKTLHSILPQLNPGDRLLVVADNCSDDTAQAAGTAGAEVIQRRDLQHRGKGYALDFGVKHLARDPPSIVMVIDADCQMSPGGIDRLARCCHSAMRPAQSLDLMHAPKNAGLGLRIAEFAWLVKNGIRPMGLSRLGLPCQLMGTGMAFPWECMGLVPLASGHIVEDLKFGLDLAMLGRPPLFCPDACVTSTFPESNTAVRSQRTRWEHGHLSVIFKEAPGLLSRALSTWNLDLFALALDLTVPPLALLTLLAVFVWSACAIALYVGRLQVPFCLASTAVLLLGLSVAIAWVCHGRRIISLGSLIWAPVYALSKIPVYARFLLARQMDWVRSSRGRDDK